MEAARKVFRFGFQEVCVRFAVSQQSISDSGLLIIDAMSIFKSE
jgi:hypothetical protein